MKKHHWMIYFKYKNIEEDWIALSSRYTRKIARLDVSIYKKHYDRLQFKIVKEPIV